MRSNSHPRGGKVQVRLERVNSHVEIIITDTGQGIRADFLPHIFDRFQQFDSTITRSQGGLGLGLAIVRHLVELQGGTVHVQSPGEGQGATFMVRLPLTVVVKTDEPKRVQPTMGEEVPSAQNANSTNETTSALTKIRVLLVDDEADARELITTILSQQGAEVTAVASAAAAIATLGQFQPDVLVSDIGMPEEDGNTLIRRIRALETAQGQGTLIPAIALTAYARLEDRTRALTAGFQMHVAKPVNATELIAAVASLAQWAKRA